MWRGQRDARGQSITHLKWQQMWISFPPPSKSLHAQPCTLTSLCQANCAILHTKQSTFVLSIKCDINLCKNSIQNKLNGLGLSICCYRQKSILLVDACAIREFSLTLISAGCFTLTACQIKSNHITLYRKINNTL